MRKELKINTYPDVQPAGLEAGDFDRVADDDVAVVGAPFWTFALDEMRIKIKNYGYRDIWPGSAYRDVEDSFAYRIGPPYKPRA